MTKLNQLKTHIVEWATNELEDTVADAISEELRKIDSKLYFLPELSEKDILIDLRIELEDEPVKTTSLSQLLKWFSDMKDLEPEAALLLAMILEKHAKIFRRKIKP